LLNNYNLYEVKLLLLLLMVETCTCDTIYSHICAYLSSQWIRSLCLHCVMYQNQQDTWQWCCWI